MSKRIWLVVLFVVAAFVVPASVTASLAEITPRLGHVLGDPFPVPWDSPAFGFRLAAAGDVDGDGATDMVVGAYLKDVDGVSNQGQAFIRSGATRAVVHVLANPTRSADAHFGESVAGLGDITGDGVPDVAVAGQGLVHLFSGADGGLFESLSRAPSGDDRGFGYPIESIGDIDGDDVADFAIGVNGEYVGTGRPQGVVHVYSGATRELAYIVPNPNPVPGVAQLFGDAIAPLGDVNGDFVPDFVVGAYQQVVGTPQGSAFTISGVDGTVLYRVTSQNPNPAFANFGRFIAEIGDVNGDTIVDFAVGAPVQEVAGNESQGEVSVYSGFDGAYLYTVGNPFPEPAAAFGEAIAGLGDVDWDGVPDLVVGAPGQDRAFVISGEDGSPLASMRHTHPDRGTRFGQVVDSLGDADRDGAVDVMIAAPDSTGGSVSGRVFVYSLPLDVGSAACTITGTDGDDVLVGTSGPDVICGFGGDDIIRGRGGDDVLRGDDGDDRIFGGTGRDIIQGNAGADLIGGGSGGDRIHGGPGADKLRGGAGDDFLHGFEGDDWILGDEGNDIIWGHSGNDRLEGNEGADIIFGGSDDDTILGGRDDDLLLGGHGTDEIRGSSGSDTIRGGSWDDRIFGGSGRDHIFGNDGNDLIDGESGRDKIRGGPGEDHLIGGEGHDVIWGGDGRDVIEGNAGDDHLEGNKDDDGLSGHDGDDELFGGRGTDTCDGGLGNDVFGGCEFET